MPHKTFSYLVKRKKEIKKQKKKISQVLYESLCGLKSEFLNNNVFADTCCLYLPSELSVLIMSNSTWKIFT